jgi:RNA polymerase sigma factor (sigma-70 family)
MANHPSLVYVLDDDDSMRSALDSLLRSVGQATECYSNAEGFLAREPFEGPNCLILDIRLPGTNGLRLHEQLQASGLFIPVIFITGHGDIRMSVEAMKAGALDFLPKPFKEQDLLDAVDLALQQSRARIAQAAQVDDAQRRLETLTPREREVLPLVLDGLGNREVAQRVGTSESTVKVHRHNMMNKLGLNSVLELARFAAELRQAGVGL